MQFFVGFIHFLSDETVTTLKNMLLAAFAVDRILLNLPTKRKKWSVGNGLTLVRFLSVRCTQKRLEKNETENMMKYWCMALNHR